MKPSTRDNILYLTIALAIVGILGLAFWYQEAHGLAHRFPVSDRQVGFVATTAVVFGYAIAHFRRSWRNLRFWVVLSLLLGAFLPAQFLLIRSMGTRIAKYRVLGMIELFVLLVILDWLVPSRDRHSGQGHPKESKS
jgi:hypothetical protein